MMLCLNFVVIFLIFSVNSENLHQTDDAKIEANKMHGRGVEMINLMLYVPWQTLVQQVPSFFTIIYRLLMFKMVDDSSVEFSRFRITPLQLALNATGLFNFVNNKLHTIRQDIRSLMEMFQEADGIFDPSDDVIKITDRTVQQLEEKIQNRSIYTRSALRSAEDIVMEFENFLQMLIATYEDDQKPDFWFSEDHRRDLESLLFNRSFMLTTLMFKGKNRDTLSVGELDEIESDILTSQRLLIENGNDLINMRTIINKEGFWYLSDVGSAKIYLQVANELMEFVGFQWYEFLKLLVYLHAMLANEMKYSYEQVFLDQARKYNLFVDYSQPVHISVFMHMMKPMETLLEFLMSICRHYTMFSEKLFLPFINELKIKEASSLQNDAEKLVMLKNISRSADELEKLLDDMTIQEVASMRLEISRIRDYLKEAEVGA